MRRLWRSAALAYSGLLLIAAKAPEGELVLEARAPTIEVVMAGVPLRLRVDPGQWDAVELSPGAAARLPVLWEPGQDAEVGRVTLAGRVAHAEMRIGTAKLKIQLAEHGRAPADGADGVIGPDLLPFARVVWRRDDVAGDATMTLATGTSEATGLVARDPALAGIGLRFSYLAETSEATAAAGARLIARYGGRIGAETVERRGAFGVMRPARRLLLDRPAPAAGWRIGAIDVRIADYRGGEARLVVDKAGPGEILVAPTRPGQHGEYWLMIGRDRLDRCREVAVTQGSLTLTCAFGP